VRVYLGRDLLTDKERYATRTVRGDRPEAERVMSELVAAADAGGHGRVGTTVGHLLERWFAEAKAGFSPKTVKETRGYLDRTLLPGLGQVPLTKLGTVELDRFYTQLRAHGGAGGRPLAPATIRRVHGIVHRALGQGVRWGWLPSNPASTASPPELSPPPETTPPTPIQVAELVGLAREANPDLATFLVLAAATGARRSELCALRWNDVDLGRGVVTLTRRIVLGPDGPVENDVTARQARRVTLDTSTAAVVADHRRLCADRSAKAAAPLRVDGFLFSQEVDGSRPWRPDTVTSTFARLCHQAGVSGLRLEDLRHCVTSRPDGPSPSGLWAPSYPEQLPTRGPMSIQPAGDDSGQRLPTHEELLARAKPFPPYEEMVIDGLTDEEEEAFLAAIAEA